MMLLFVSFFFSFEFALRVDSNADPSACDQAQHEETYTSSSDDEQLETLSFAAKEGGMYLIKLNKNKIF